MIRKTKADLERELEELRKKIGEDTEVVIPKSLIETWAPAAVAILGVVIVLGWQGIRGEPKPKPDPSKPSVERTTGEVLPQIRKGYGDTFTQAADRVKTGEIKTDKALFEFVQPALVQLRKDKQRPFDEMFQMSLPRAEDGTFAGEESEVEDFLRRIAKSW